MQRAYYSNTIRGFLTDNPNTVLGQLVKRSEFAVEQSQRDAWLAQIDHLKEVLISYSGSVYFEYAIPRMGKRVDVVLVIGPAIFVLEYKVGEDHFAPYNIDQAVDYSLDLKNFHEPSHNHFIVPVLIATNAPIVPVSIALTLHNDKFFAPVTSNG